MSRLGVVLMSCVWLAGCLTLPADVAAELEPARQDELNVFAARVPARALSGAATVDPDTLPLTRRTERRGVALNDLPLASGQTVVTEDGRVSNLFASLFAEDYSPWTHVGIVSLETEGPVVYHTDMAFFPVPGLPPTVTASGGVYRTPFAQYVSGQKIIGIYSLPPAVDAQKVVAFAREHFERGTPFDAFFDSGDAGALYCSELVALAHQAAGSAPIRQAALRANPSYVVARQWLGVRATQFFLPAHFADPSREVALWSPDLSPAQIEAYFEIRREISQRFDARARLGHLFRWTGATLVLRDEPRRFVETSLAAFASHEGSIDSVREKVRRLAESYFSGAPRVGTALAPGDAR